LLIERIEEDVMKKILLIALSVAAFLVITTRLQAEMAVDEIVRKANHTAYYEGKDGKANAKMVITD